MLVPVCRIKAALFVALLVLVLAAACCYGAGASVGDDWGFNAVTTQIPEAKIGVEAHTCCHMSWGAL